MMNDDEWWMMMMKAQKGLARARRGKKESPARQGSHVDCGRAGSTGHIATRDNYGCPEGIHSQNGHNFHECYYVSLLFRVAFRPFQKNVPRCEDQG